MIQGMWNREMGSMAVLPVAAMLLVASSAGAADAGLVDRPAMYEVSYLAHHGRSHFGSTLDLIIYNDAFTEWTLETATDKSAVFELPPPQKIKRGEIASINNTGTGVPGISGGTDGYVKYIAVGSGGKRWFKFKWYRPSYGYNEYTLTTAGEWPTAVGVTMGRLGQLKPELETFHPTQMSNHVVSEWSSKDGFGSGHITLAGLSLAGSKAPPWGTPPKVSKCEDYNGVLRDGGFKWTKIAGADELSKDVKGTLKSLEKIAKAIFPKALSKKEPGRGAAVLGGLLGAIMFGCKIFG